MKRKLASSTGSNDGLVKPTTPARNISSAEIILHQQKKTPPLPPPRNPGFSTPPMRNSGSEVLVNPSFVPPPASDLQKQRDYEKELKELKVMLEEQKKVNDELLKFKKKYEDHYRKKLSPPPKGVHPKEHSLEGSSSSNDLFDSIELYELDDDEDDEDGIIIVEDK